MRLFIAVEPTPDFRAALADLQARLKAAGIGGRFLDPSNLHLTLAFIGEWQEDVTEVLPAVDGPFSLTLSSLGIFPRAKVLWAGVRASQELDALTMRVRERLDEAKIPYDHQDFNPHITLVRKPVLPEDDALSAIHIPPASMIVRETCLYQSDHGVGGMKYTVIGRSGNSFI